MSGREKLSRIGHRGRAAISHTEIPGRDLLCYALSSLKGALLRIPWFSQTVFPCVLLHCTSQAEAKDAFKAMLASVGCTSEWSWEQAMKHIVNDPR